MILTSPAPVVDGLELRIRLRGGAIGPSREDLEWPGRVRRIIRAKLRMWSLRPLSPTVELLATELVTNALQYGGPEMVVRIERFATYLLIQVDDSTPVAATPGVAGPLDENGRGLLLVDALAKSWGVRDAGRCTWCTVAIPITPGSA